MIHTSENRVCQNCRKDFTIEPEDFSFYEKMKVPAPTFCPDCRFQRRLSWRNDRSLYKRDCSFCGESIISMYHKDVPFPVFCRKCWYSDNWEAIDYGRDYDFHKPFFEQFNELLSSIPHLAIWQRNTVDSPFSNMVAESKNVYLSISVVMGSENVSYSWGIDKSFNIVDCHNLKESDSCYENIEGEKNYNSQYLMLSRNCIDSYYLVDCVNCSNCFMSSNLRNKQFYFKNEQLTEEEYLKKLENVNLKSRECRKELKKDFENLCKTAVYRFSNVTRATNSTGNNLINVNNCINGFELYNDENCKNCYRVLNEKDSMDVTYAGKAEMLYEYLTGALNDYNIRFGISGIDSVQNADYIEFCISCNNIFGCAGLSKKDNAILNKVYSEEEFKILREKIIKHMEEFPYVDKKGNVYKYGEFFPIEISPFAYNETLAQDFFPLSQDEIIESGFKWKDPEIKSFSVTIKSEDIVDSIDEIDENILNETLGCGHDGNCNHKCMKAFRLTKDELAFYKKHNIPIPDLCSNCRYYERFSKICPPKLWHRKCMKEGCNTEFETSYSPDRPEIIYCEKCYQQEVY